jgi:hypothetical protein
MAYRIVLVCAALFVLLIVALINWRVRLNKRINTRLAAIRAAGLPTSPAELNAWIPKIPDSENGALLLMRALTNLHDLPEISPRYTNDVISLKRQQHFSAEQRQIAEQFVQTNAQALVEIKNALRYPKFRYPIDYSRGTAAELPHLAKIKVATQVLQCENTLQSEDHIAAWTNSVLLQLRLAETLDSEPDLIGSFVRVAVVNIASRSAEFALNRLPPDIAGCQLLRDTFLRTTQTNLLPQALISERAVYLPEFPTTGAQLETFLKSHDTNAPLPRFGVNSLFWTGIFARDLDFYLSTIEKGIEASRLPAPGNLRLTNIFDVDDVVRRRFFVMSGMLLPNLGRTSIRAASAEAIAKLAASAFAIEEFRQANNRLPENLKDLTPQFLEFVPIDPFDGNPIRYRKLEHGYLVYSVDADGRDDGGESPPVGRKSKNTNTYDLTFTVER